MRSTAELRASIIKGAHQRNETIARFGFVPSSIVTVKRGSFSRSLYSLVREVPGRNARECSAVLRKREALHQAGYAGAASQPSGYHGADSGTLSIMPGELVRFFCCFYSQAGETYLDPFMGCGTRMQVAKLMRLNYHGYDVCAEFMRFNRAVKDKIDDGATRILIYEADSRLPDQIPDGVGDFCFTSPPYYRAESYGPEAAQLSEAESYPAFLDALGVIAKAWLPKFKPTAYCVVNVGDFKTKGSFFAYGSCDTINVFKRSGWQHTDTWIVKGLNSLQQSWAVARTQQRIAARVHEYAHVFRPPRTGR